MRALMLLALLLGCKEAAQPPSPQSAEADRAHASGQAERSQQPSGPTSEEMKAWEAAERAEANAAAKRVAACGFADVHTRDDGAPDKFWVEVRTRTATKVQLTCVAKVSAETEVGVGFPKKLHDAYFPIHERSVSEVVKQRSRAELERRGLLSRVPKYHPGSDVLALARSLERLCGRKAAGAFRFAEEDGFWITAGQITWMEGVFIDDETRQCLYAAIEVSGLPSDSLYAPH